MTASLHSLHLQLKALRAQRGDVRGRIRDVRRQADVGRRLHNVARQQVALGHRGRALQRSLCSVGCVGGCGELAQDGD